MILFVRLISRTFCQNASKTALFEHSLKKLFAGMPPCVLSLKKLFCQNISKLAFSLEKCIFQIVSQKILWISI